MFDCSRLDRQKYWFSFQGPKCKSWFLQWSSFRNLTWRLTNMATNTWQRCHSGIAAFEMRLSRVGILLRKRCATAASNSNSRNGAILGAMFSFRRQCGRHPALILSYPSTKLPLIPINLINYITCEDSRSSLSHQTSDRVCVSY